MLEAHSMGVSKRVPAVPKELKLGETWVYLVHRKGIETGERDPKTGKMKYKMAIFAAFIPQAIEMPVWESELTEERKTELEKRGITPVPIKDGDKDHAPVTRKKKTAKPKDEQMKLPPVVMDDRTRLRMQRLSQSYCPDCAIPLSRIKYNAGKSLGAHGLGIDAFCDKCRTRWITDNLGNLTSDEE
jgi:hypothetical protein